MRAGGLAWHGAQHLAPVLYFILRHYGAIHIHILEYLLHAGLCLTHHRGASATFQARRPLRRFAPVRPAPAPSTGMSPVPAAAAGWAAAVAVMCRAMPHRYGGCSSLIEFTADSDSASTHHPEPLPPDLVRLSVGARGAAETDPRGATCRSPGRLPSRIPAPGLDKVNEPCPQRAPTPLVLWLPVVSAGWH